MTDQREPHPDLPAWDSPLLAHITPDLRGIAVPITDVVEDAANLRVHNERSQQHLKSSYGEFKQRKNVVVQIKEDGTRVVRAGNGTLSALVGLGFEWIAASLIREDDLTATRFAIADNRTAELSVWDLESLQQVLPTLGDDLPGMDQEWLNEINAILADGDFTQLPEVGDDDDGAGEDTTSMKLVVEFATEQSVKEGALAIATLLRENPAWGASLK